MLDAAIALFTAEGIQGVDIEKIVAESGVPEKVFRWHFPSKDDLVSAYLTYENVQIRCALAPRDIAPETQIMSLFEVISELSDRPGFRGCPFINAAAEYPDPEHPVRQVVAAHRRWFREVLHDLLVAAGRPDADRVADVLVLLRDGLFVRGEFDDEVQNGELVHDAVLRILGLPNLSRQEVGQPVPGRQEHPV